MDALLAEVEWRLCTAYDLSGFYEMAEKNAGLGKAARQFRGLKPGQDVHLFEALVGTILGQQLSTAVALTMQRRLIEKYGQRVTFNDEEFWLSPTPDPLHAGRRRRVESLQALGPQVAVHPSHVGSGCDG